MHTRLVFWTSEVNRSEFLAPPPPSSFGIPGLETPSCIRFPDKRNTFCSRSCCSWFELQNKVSFIGEMPLKTQKRSFQHQEQAVVKFWFTCNGCKPMHTEGDADLCIIQTALEAASQGSTYRSGYKPSGSAVFSCWCKLGSSLFQIWRKTNMQENRTWHVHDSSAHLPPNLPFTTFHVCLFWLRYHFTIVWYR